jgi:hypothetical protein
MFAENYPGISYQVKDNKAVLIKEYLKGTHPHPSLTREGLIGGNDFIFCILTEQINEKFYNDNKVSLFLRERFRVSSHA